MAGMDVFLDRLDPDMCVVTAAAGGEEAGCLVGFASQCSMRPVRFVVWLSEVNRTFRVARSAEYLAVHLLARGQHGLAEVFGGRTGDDVDKFRQVRKRRGHGGTVLLEDAEAWFVGRVVERVAGGDHVGHVLEPVEWGGRETPGRPLLRLGDVSGVEAGHPVD
ncbi:flavin reductase family protein [Streptomyces sp. NPDC032940]|uniref:flavin reductase family protein n=1 Tax=Streptomyces sp. NPDC032940 TaxID=3155366 RepID=UPI0033E6C4CB